MTLSGAPRYPISGSSHKMGQKGARLFFEIANTNRDFDMRYFVIKCAKIDY